MKICKAMRATVRVMALAGLAALFAGMAWQAAQPGFRWSFPGDHWSHPEYAREWWYFTGHLQDVNDPGRRFGYQFTVFRIGLVPPGSGSAASGVARLRTHAAIASLPAEIRAHEATALLPAETRPHEGLAPLPEEDGSRVSSWQSRQLFMGHAAIGDLRRGEHHFSDVLYREIPLLAGFGAPDDPLIAWSRGPAGTEEKWTLRWNGAGFDLEMRDQARGMALSLSTRPTRPLVFQGPGGLSRKGHDDRAASLYYSFTRLETRGQLTLDGTTWDVRGTSWMDREFGSAQLSPGQVGWDWMGLQLEDGRDLMLYLLRQADGSIDFRNATLVTAAGKAHYLEPGQWSLRVLERRRSRATGTEYPSRWRLEIPGENLSVEIVPVFADQENVAARSANLHYWEGAVQVLDGRKREVGRGYVELTGYGEGNRPPI